MSANNGHNLNLIRIVGYLMATIIVVFVTLILKNTQVHAQFVETTAALEYEGIAEGPSDIYNQDYTISNLDDSKENALIKYGYELFVNTPKYIGPKNGNAEMAFAGNGLSCNNCHLLAGTKAYSGPLLGIVNRFPQYRGRENKMGTIEERIDGCMERSMNGRKMPSTSVEMKAFVSYLEWLSRFAPSDGIVEGSGFLKIDIPDRAVDLTHGKKIFDANCIECHGVDGQGVLFPSSLVYQYPPLWGENSYNNGAGMTRVLTSAQFIKGNMPYGTTYKNPKLTDEEAYDVAGYINQQFRPVKKNLEVDFPDLLKKPVSTPYPPFLDPFSVEQHQLGPFLPIIDFYQKEYGIKKSK